MPQPAKKSDPYEKTADPYGPRRLKDIKLYPPDDPGVRERMKKRPLYSDKEVSPELVLLREYWRKKEKK